MTIDNFIDQCEFKQYVGGRRPLYFLTYHHHGHIIMIINYVCNFVNYFFYFYIRLNL